MPIYMKLTDERGAFAVVGGSKAKGHEKWIELESVQQGVQHSMPRPAYTHREEGARHSQISEVVITKRMDAASAHLFRLAASPIGRMGGRIDIVRDGKDANGVSMSLIFEDILISSYSTSGHGGDGSTRESLSLNYEKITYS